MMATDKVLARIQRSWDALHDYVDTLAPQQITALTDAGGWTIKDHLIHLALWEGHLLRILNGEDLIAGFGVSEEVFKKGSDAVNAVLQPRYSDMPLDEVRAVMAESHAAVVARVAAMSEADLALPYHHYQPTSRRNAPIEGWIAGNTSGHYNSHLRWIKAIVED
ncbi:MAG: ClbS/DfsB family four-helix bundle protein [Chloroflexi bacterium]|nr:ClbS/DfsB family four-helix bundle protein [Chloroflexota bacterium]